MNLQNFFKINNRVALAFSGGVDSAYLLYAGLRYGAEIRAYYVNSQFQPEFELNDAKRLVEELGADMKIIDVDILAFDDVVSNSEFRCYYCKQKIFGSILAQAEKDGFNIVIDGTNASDDSADRPGMKALREMKVFSPLRECGLDKKKIRQLSKEAGLFTWDKPSYACLATRIQSNIKIEASDLRKVELAENAISEMGFSDFRVRVFNRAARLQVKEKQMCMAIEKHGEIVNALKPYFDDIMLDLEER